MSTLNVLLVAEEAAGARALQLVARSGHHVVGVVTSSRQHADGAGPAAAAVRADVPVLPAQVANEALVETLRRERVDLLLNVHSLRVLPAEVLAVPRIGCFNLHPGPLPRYAGLNAPCWAIYEEATRYGCSLHWMTPKIDAGPIAYAAEFDVAPRETGLSLSVKCVRYGLPLVEQLIADAGASGRAAIPAHEQPAAERRYLRRGPPENGDVPWQEPAARVDALVRASNFEPLPSPWGKPRTSVDGVEVSVMRVRSTQLAADAAPGTIRESIGGDVHVAARDEWVAVEEVEVEGQRVPPAAVLQPGRRCRRATSHIAADP